MGAAGAKLAAPVFLEAEMGAIKTGVFATEVERQEMQRQSETLRSMPLIFPFGLKTAAADDKRNADFAAEIDRLAVSHGLPPPKLIGGEIIHYGMNNDGEFTEWDGT